VLDRIDEEKGIASRSALIEAILRGFFEAESEGGPRKVVGLATMKRSF